MRNTEKGLVAESKNGNGGAERQFWKTHWTEVYAITCHILGSNSDATDVAVDTLTDFMTHYVHNLTNHNSQKAYIRLMATRRALRFRNRRNRLVPTDVDYFEDGKMLNPEERALFSQLMPRLSDCMEHLTPKAQTVVRLRYRKQMTKTAISTTVGVSKQYIGRLLNRSLALLKQCLDIDDSNQFSVNTGKTQND